MNVFIFNIHVDLSRIFKYNIGFNYITEYSDLIAKFNHSVNRNCLV